MKHIFISLLTFILLLTLCSCSSEDTTAFYYQRIDYEYGAQDGVIASDQREIIGHEGDLSYLLALYLVGPMDEALTSPFPAGTRLVSAEKTEDTIHVELSDVSSDLSESQFTLACACLTLTCLELEDAAQVTITSGERSVTMTRESLMLFDSTPTVTEETK